MTTIPATSGTNTNTPATGGTSGTNGTGSTSSTSSNQLSINNGIASLADNFQSLLTLLTTQLQNQDPLNPTDTNQFTAQITQMTGVEQQLLSNQLLQQLVATQGGVTAAANLIGDTVSASIPGATASAAATPISGVVTSVTSSNGQTILNIGNQQVPLSDVTGVSGVTNPLSSLLGSGG
jgi:flagellar basal-body rod modification protein FlgD